MLPEFSWGLLFVMLIPVTMAMHLFRFVALAFILRFLISMGMSMALIDDLLHLHDLIAMLVFRLELSIFHPLLLLFLRLILNFFKH